VDKKQINISNKSINISCFSQCITKDKTSNNSIKKCRQLDVPPRADRPLATHWEDLSFDCLIESDQKTYKLVFTAFLLDVQPKKKQCDEQTSNFTCCVLG